MLYKITPSLTLNDKGTAVSNLKAALKQLLVQMQNFGQSKDSALLTDFEKDVASATFTVATAKVVSAFQVMVKLPQAGKVDEGTAKAINEILNLKEELPELPLFILTGTVTSSDGIPVANKKVAAYDKDLRKEELLGTNFTAKDGSYKISYTADKFSRAEKQTADVFIRVTDLNLGNIFNTGNDKPDVIYHTSAVLYNAPQNALIDAVLDAKLYRSMPEFERYLITLKPLLDGQNVEVKDLNEEDIRFLTNETGINSGHLSLLIKAHLLGSVQKITPEVYYGLLRQNLPTTIKELLSIKQQKLRDAMVKSIEQNIISSDLLKQLDKLMGALLEGAKQLLPDAKDTTYTGFGAIVARAEISDVLKQKLIALYLQNNEADFDKIMTSDPELGQKKIQTEIKFVFAAKQIAGNDLNLLTTLSSAKAAMGLVNDKDIARLEKTDWAVLIKTSGIPAEVKGANEKEKTDNYAATLNAKTEKIFPTQVLQARLAKATDKNHPFVKGKNDLLAFLKSNPSYDVRSTSVSELVKEKSGLNFSNISNKKELIENLSSINRLQKVTSNYDGIMQMVANRLLSSLQIVQQPIAQFSFDYAAVLGDIQISRQVYNDAFMLNQLAVIIGAGIYPRLHVPFYAIYGEGHAHPASTNSAATWQSIFGSLDSCDCEHCMSVYSPAAYFTDLLHFLYQKSAAAFNELMRRRPDLQYILLNCANTNIPMPYIDLVNEVLSRKIHGTLATDKYQTTWTAEELNANPENFNSTYLSSLAGVNYPFSLPYDDARESIRIYMKQVGAELHEVMEAFATEDWATNTPLAAEYLGLSQLETAQVTRTGNSSAAPYLGYSNATDEGWIDDIKQVRKFLQKTAVSYVGLLELLNCIYTNRLRQINLSNPESCDTSAIEITGLNNQKLYDLYKVIKLSKRTGWSFYELDQCLTSLGTANINPETIRQLSIIKRLQNKFNIPLTELLMLWSGFDFHIYKTFNADGQPAVPTLFEKLFLNNAVIKPQDTGLFTSVINEETISFSVATTTINGIVGPTMINGHEDLVMSALQISEADLLLLLGTDEIPSPAGLPDRVLSVSNLEILFRHALIGRLLNLSIADLLQIKRITGWSSSPSEVWKFISNVEFIKGAKFSVEELRYLLNSDSSSLRTLRQTDEEINSALEILADGLQKVVLLNFGSLINTLSFVKGEILTAIKDKNVFGEVLKLIVNNLMSSETALIPMAEQKLLSTAIPIITLNTIADADDITKLNAFLSAVITSMREQFSAFDDKPQSWLVQQLKEKFQIDATIILKLISTYNPGAKLSFFKLLTNGNPFPPELIDLYRLLDRICYFINKLKLPIEELEFIKTRQSSVNALDLLQLDATDFTAEKFTQFIKLVKLVQLRDSLPKGELSLFDIMELAHGENPISAKNLFVNFLKNMTGWNEMDMGRLIKGEDPDADGWIVQRDEYKNGTAIESLKRKFDFANRIGASIGFCIQLDSAAKLDAITTAAVSTATAAAAAAKNLLKSKSDAAQWLKIAKPLSDSLRTKRRDMLVDYLVYADVPDKTWVDVDGLYEYLLIDVQMDACMTTSRIKQAISSVQLFMDRVLMNLEPAASFDTQSNATDFADQWKKWRKIYRIWEANRKIFLYPENWIEPALRDNKSSFFEELESQLSQNEISNETAEDALRAYLEKLDEVAQLEIVGMCRHSESGFNERAIDILHVFGRTYAEPHLYYHRKLENNEWSNWEKVDLNIEGDNLIPVVWQRKLYLFWPRFTEKSEPLIDGDNSLQIPTAGTPAHASLPAKYWEVKLCWSQYKGNKWLSKKISNDSIKLDYGAIDLPTGRTPRFTTTIDPNDDNSQLILYNPSTLSIFCSGCVYKHFEITDSHPEVRVVNGLGSPYMYNGNAYVDQGQFFALGDNITPRNLSVFNTSDDNPVVLQNISRPFKILFACRRPHQISDTDPMFYANTTSSYFFYMDWGNFSDHAEGEPLVGNKTFFIKGDGGKFAIKTFCHSHTSNLIAELNKKGIDGLYDPSIQRLHESDTLNTFLTGPFQPNVDVLIPDTYPSNKIDFDFGEAYSNYNWELFFHIPLLIATQLSKNQKFEEARKWFHYIFNPTVPALADEGVERFWVTKPFYELVKNNRILSLEELMSSASDYLHEQIEKWEENPFQPHIIARMRLEAYMKTVMMKYIDNLISWGDQLYMRDTIETVNEATQLYVLAAKLLSRPPEKIPSRVHRADKDYNELSTEGDGLDDFSNAAIQIESYINTPGGTGNNPEVHIIKPFYFCLIPNQQLLGYWEKIKQRLFRVRHCMNIDGVVRQLPLFEPPIDPALLVRASAAGLDLSDVLRSVDGALPNYRFNIMMQKANELCNEVKSLGAMLLSAIEKRDAEKLSLIRSGHEIKMLDAIKTMKVKQVEEATENYNALTKSREAIQARKAYYSNLVNDGWNSHEKAAFALSTASTTLDTIISTGYIHAGVLAAIPQFIVGASGFGGTPHATAKTPPFNEVARLAMEGLGQIAHSLDKSASLATTVANYERRGDEWNFQALVADKDLQQMDKQILVAEIRLAMAEKDLENHLLQTENSKEADDYMRGKFSNNELYDWMVGQISTTYFQSYQLAYEVALKAQKCFNSELGFYDTAAKTFIQFGKWDNLKKGLVAGELLQFDLRTMELDYMEENKREFELVKHVSIAQLNPEALLLLKQTGCCDIHLPEELFDLDFAGHYFRRIKSVSLSIPCIAGPYTSINCSLKLNSSFIQVSNRPSSSRYIDSKPAFNDIAVSSAQNDSGVFELNFRDERYLPFEGAGVKSTWSLDLPNPAFAQFDYNTISDVIMHVKYTARKGDADARAAVSDSLKAKITQVAENGLTRIFSLKNDFPDAFHLLLNPSIPTPRPVTIKFEQNHFSYFLQNKNIAVSDVEVWVKCGQTLSRTTIVRVKTILYDGNLSQTANGIAQLTKRGTEIISGNPFLGNWPLSIEGFESQNPDDVFIVLKYTV